MEKVFKILLYLTFAVISFLPAQAQNYVIENIYGDSVCVNNILLNKDKTAESPGATAFYLHNGDTVTVTRILLGNHYPAVCVKGKSGEYTLGERNLVFCDNNPVGTVDYWADKSWNKNRGINKFFASFTPYAIIALLFVVAMAFLFLGLKVDSLRKNALYVVPACLLLASILEIWAYYVMGNDAFWWCDKSRYGFFGSLFRAIPFVAFVGFQLYSFKLYQGLLLGKDSDNTLSIKPMAISLAICIPVALAVVVLLAICGIRGRIADILTLIVFLGSLTAGILMSLKKNIQLLGKTAGIAFSIFGIVYIIGSLVAIWGLIVVLFRLIIQIIIICAAILGVGFAMGQSDSSSGSASGYVPSSKTVWLDEDGNKYNNEADAQSANKRIAERKANN